MICNILQKLLILSNFEAFYMYLETVIHVFKNCSKRYLFFLSSRFFNFHSNLSHSKKFLCNLYTCLLHTILIYLLGKIKLHQHKLTDAIYWLFYMQYLLGLFLSIICWCCLCTDLDRYLCHGNNSILLSHNILFF